jgi:peptidoglycan/LPS O-acetylase OafA/YrhL
MDVLVSDTGEVFVEVSPPDIPPTRTPIPTITPTAMPVATETPDPKPQPPVVNFGDLLLSLFGLAAISIAVFVFGLSRRDLNYGLLLSLPTVVVGLTSYNYYALYMPGARSWRNLMGDLWGAGVFTWIGALIGLALTMVVLYTVKRLPRTPSGKRGHRRQESH